MKIVVVEWDGGQPPSRWYNRLHEVGLYSRGDKSKSPVERRAGRSEAVVFQEGAIILDSEHLARTLAALAYELGAKAVLVGDVALEEYAVSVEDEAALARISKKRRGPKPVADKGEYAVTCLEEARVHFREYDELPRFCPSCGSTRIRAQKEENTPKHKRPTSYEEWVGSRFASGSFMIVGVGDDEPPVVDMPVDMPAGVEDAFRRFGAEGADAAYCVGLLSEKERLARRIEVARRYYVSGGSGQLRLAVPKEVDDVDLAWYFGLGILK